MKNIIQKITDIATIVFPAVIAVFGVLHLAGAAQVTNVIEQIVIIVLGVLSAVASVIYNQAAKNTEA